MHSMQPASAQFPCVCAFHSRSIPNFKVDSLLYGINSKDITLNIMNAFEGENKRRRLALKVIISSSSFARFTPSAKVHWVSGL
jgi:hypothetical protein